MTTSGRVLSVMIVHVRWAITIPTGKKMIDAENAIAPTSHSAPSHHPKSTNQTRRIAQCMSEHDTATDINPTP